MAPIDYISGNLSGHQQLQYSSNGDRAFAMGIGTAPAINYQPRLIAVHRASDGKRYFMVRTKHTANNSEASRSNWALMGATYAIVGAIMRAKNTSIYNSIYSQYLSSAVDRTFRQWAISCIRVALVAKSTTINLGSIAINNPFTAAQQTTGLEIPDDVINKFADLIN